MRGTAHRSASPEFLKLSRLGFVSFDTHDPIPRNNQSNPSPTPSGSASLPSRLPVAEVAITRMPRQARRHRVAACQMRRRASKRSMPGSKRRSHRMPSMDMPSKSTTVTIHSYFNPKRAFATARFLLVQAETSPIPSTPSRALLRHLNGSLRPWSSSRSNSSWLKEKSLISRRVSTR
jgi:hypothetical protein